MRELGERLKRRRLDRDITLDEVQSATKIRLRYLTALEDGQFDVIPGEVYLKGFLRTYADYLGLDGLELLRSYQEMREQRYREAMQVEEGQEEGDGAEVPPEASDGPSDSAVPTPAPGVISPVGADDTAPMPTYRPLRPVRRKAASRRWVLPVAVIGLVLAAFVVVTVWVAGSGERVATVTSSGEGVAQQDDVVRAPAANRERVDAELGGNGRTATRPGSDEVPPSSEDALVPQPRAEEVSGVGGAALASASSRVQSIKLEVRARQNCWLRVLVDGEPAYEGTMIPGERRVWEASDLLHIRLGHARGVDLILNGQQLDAPDHDVIEREFTRASVARLIGSDDG